MEKFSAFLKRKKGNLPIVLIIVVSLCAMIYYGHQKQGYHVDELYSYGLANSEYLPFMHFGVSDYDVKDWMNEYGAGESFGDLFSNLVNDFKLLKDCNFDFYNSEIYHAYRIAQANSADTYTTSWVPGQDYIDYLGVSESNTFNYASVYYNQRGDVHPPFFYILLHTICSVFQGQFSKWFGLTLNMVLLLTALMFLYKMSVEYFGGKEIALAIVTAYAFSGGFMTTAMFIRMYSLLTLMTLLCCYVHLKIQQNNYLLSKKLSIALFFSVLGGYYTQYYFVLYAFVIAVVMLIAMLIHKKYKSAIKYVAVLACSAITGIIIWPFSVKHVFSGYRGQESLSILTTGNFYWYKAEYMFNHLINQMFGGHKILPIFALTAAILVCLLLWRILWKNPLPFAKLSIVALPVLVYTFLVGQISPFLSERYIMCTYPIWCVIVVCMLYYSAEFICRVLSEKSDHFMESRKRNHLLIRRVISVSIMCIIFCSNNYFIHTPGYLYPDGQETYHVPDGTDCVFIIPDGSYNESAEESSILAQCDWVGVVYAGNIDVLAEEYQYESGDHLLVEIINHLDADEMVSKVKESLNVTELKEINRSQGSNCVRILLGE